MRLLGVMFLAVALAAGCAQAGPATGPSGSSSGGTATVGPGSPGSSPGSPAPTDLGVVMTTEPGKVTVKITIALLAVGKPIFVTVANGLPRTIYAQDEKTDCSIVLLERWTGKEWDAVTGCLFGRTPLPVAIGTGRGRIVRIDPLSAHLNRGQPQGAPAFGLGTYRVKFSYGFSAAFGAPEPYTLVSAEFAVR